MATRSNDPKIAAIQNDLDQVKVVMEQNVEKALRNTEKLEDLEVRTDQLQQNAHQFKSGSTRLKVRACCDPVGVCAHSWCFTPHSTHALHHNPHTNRTRTQPLMNL
eukprot:TRINITY_DN10875_c0_g1_i1.p1 TRINITY_DN10875_c0_g1~~TRINITY_DN10875_c0_g1_i1.p1  ORF type:complete len:106 (+),score=6.11 TRINITY_DN10875_c0_g1_i1:165-482(+)